MSLLVLGVVDVVVLAWLVSTYLRLRRRLADIAATVTVDFGSVDATESDGQDRPASPPRARRRPGWCAAVI